jgi:CHAT domain-containing protein
VLMALHAREPQKGWDAAALEASETARARSLLEVLTAARADVTADVDPALRTAEEDLALRMERARVALGEVLGRAHTPGEADRVERDLEDLRAERERLEARMRASSPRYAALAPAAPLSIAEIRERLLDDSTALVEYLLGEQQSFVWVVSRTEVRSAVLPGRRAVERAVKALYRRWSDPAALDDAPIEARALSRMVLGPIAGALGPHRLVVVADGALQQIPFAALPLPGTGRALLESHAVVGSPSASVLAVLRARPPASGPGAALALLADPVLAGTGRQARPDLVASRSPLLVRSMEDAGLKGLEPLPGSRQEALAIAALLPGDRVLAAFGAEASRATAMGADVARARIVHFATHALLDVRRPELSGIVLSERDPEGRPQNGFLSLADISSLRLSADLVVLSACRTGLGKEVRGEGLVGLTRGFMDAGASRVVASLWKVSDTATAALMARFYRKLLEEHLSPADALREAQRALRKERRTSAPHAWAGFVLEGDWRPLPVSGAGTAPPR